MLKEEGLLSTILTVRAKTLKLALLKVRKLIFFNHSCLEISEYKCLYPYVFYCKGNAEIYIHCIYHPNKVYKHELEQDGKDIFYDEQSNVGYSIRVLVGFELRSGSCQFDCPGQWIDSILIDEERREDPCKCH